jgi:murein DD-endopeptidase MepM/ murein hydrolase activator NlpD
VPTPTPPPIVGSDIVEIAQGRSGVLRIEAGAASATASYKGRSIPLVPGAGGFWGVIGAAADEGIGQFPIAVTLYDASGAAMEQRSATLIVYDASFPIESITLPPGEEGLLGPDVGAQEEAIRQQQFASSAPERRWSGAFIYPVYGAAVTSPYGQQRSYNGAPPAGFHHGTDFGVDEGTAVYASASGVVTFAAAMPIRGNSVIIDHGAGVFSGYHHLSSVAVAVGQNVAQGQLIAHSGMSGLATGPHLHWEVVVHGVSVDPLFWTQNAVGP